MVDICVIGGGPGGLFTSHYLLKKEPSLNVTIYESTPRLGGKILTQRFSTVPAMYEGGVAELYHAKKFEDTLLALFKELDLSFVKMGGDVAIYKGRIVKNIDDLKNVVGEACWKALKDFVKLGKSHRSPEEFSGAGWPDDNDHPWTKLTLREVLDKYCPNEDAKNFFLKIIESDLATEPGVTSGTYGFDNYLVDDADYCQIYTISTGISSMVEALIETLTDRVRFVTNAPVRSVKKLASGKYRVVSKDEENLVSNEYDAVVVCLPIQWIPSVDYAGNLASAVAKHHKHYFYPAHYLRVACLFKEPFWHETVGTGSYFRLDAFGGCCVYDETSRYPHPPYGVLNWLIAGSNAEAMSNFGDDLLITRTLESLPPKLAVQAKEQLLEGRVHRWIGSVNGQPGGVPVKGLKEKHLVDPKNHPNFVMVGDYLFDSTLNGLIDSADLATNFLLENLQKTQLVARRNPTYSLSPRLQKLMRKRR